MIESELAFLDGALEVQPIDGATFGPRGSTRTVPIIQASGVLHGEFDTAPEGDLGDGVFVDVLYGVSSVVLSVTIANPGDANGDGRVDTTDIGVWHANRFRLGSWVNGDFPGDGEDFNIWLANRFRVDPVAVPTIPGPPRSAMAAFDAAHRLTQGPESGSVATGSTTADSDAVGSVDLRSGDDDVRGDGSDRHALLARTPHRLDEQETTTRMAIRRWQTL